MDKQKAHIAYCRQVLGAHRRGIEWQFTFETWLAWWGEDLDKRGVRHDQLCMQRIMDKGPYHPDNCIKGSPRQNLRTWQNAKFLKKSQEKATAYQRELDNIAPMSAEEAGITEDEQELQAMFGVGSSCGMAPRDVLNKRIRY